MANEPRRCRSSSPVLLSDVGPTGDQGCQLAQRRTATAITGPFNRTD